MKNITVTMVNIYGMQKVDWMGYELQKDDMFSYHHNITKKEDGGNYSIKNGAILCGKTSHPYIHLIESLDFDMYLYLTKLLTEVNLQRHMPTDKQFVMINNILRQFENEHEKERNKKGKILIKEEYKKRIII